MPHLTIHQGKATPQVLFQVFSHIRNFIHLLFCYLFLGLGLFTKTLSLKFFKGGTQGSHENMFCLSVINFLPLILLLFKSLLLKNGTEAIMHELSYQSHTMKIQNQQLPSHLIMQMHWLSFWQAPLNYKGPQKSIAISRQKYLN